MVTNVLVCRTCKFWSDKVARIKTGKMEAMCLAHKGPKSGSYMDEYGVCRLYTRGKPIDEE